LLAAVAGLAIETMPVRLAVLSCLQLVRCHLNVIRFSLATIGDDGLTTDDDVPEDRIERAVVPYRQHRFACA
jgi:hypothetical protein